MFGIHSPNLKHRTLTFERPTSNERTWRVHGPSAAFKEYRKLSVNRWLAILFPFSSLIVSVSRPVSPKPLNPLIKSHFQLRFPLHSLYTKNVRRAPLSPDLNMKPMRHIGTPRAAAQPRKSSIYFVPLTFFCATVLQAARPHPAIPSPLCCPRSIHPAKNRSVAFASFALRPAVYTFSSYFFEFANNNVVFGSEFRPFTRLLSYTQKMCEWCSMAPDEQMKHRGGRAQFRPRVPFPQNL